MIDFQRYHACPRCQNDVGTLYGKFVDPSDPLKVCPACGKTIHKMRGSNGLRIVIER